MRAGVQPVLEQAQIKREKTKEPAMARWFQLLFSALSLSALGTVPLFPAWTDGYVRTSDGVRLHYIEAGSGPAIVLEPGWTMPAEIWQPQIDALSKNFRVVAIDPRSQGKSDRPTDGHYPERRAQDIKEIIDQLKLAPAVLVGWSLGVAEVLTYADQFGTSTLRGIVLVDGDIGRDPDPKRIAWMWDQVRAYQTRRAEWTANFVRSMYKKPQSEEYLKRIREASMSVPTNSATLLILNAYASGRDWRPALKKVDKPVLYAISTTEKAQGEMLKQELPSARVESFENDGHALFVDEPARFNALLADFAASLK
jgi:non-heme chloroperoxidase